MDQQNIKLKSKEGDIIEFNYLLKDISKYIENFPSLDDEIYLKSIPTYSMEFIKMLLEAHNYEIQNMKWTYPFTSNKLSEHIDQISYNFFQQYDMSNTNDKELIKQNNIKFASIIELCFLLDIRELKKISNITLQIPFWCPPGESSIEDFKVKWGIKDDHETNQKLLKLIDLNKPIFDNISQTNKNLILLNIEESKKPKKIIENSDNQIQI